MWARIEDNLPEHRKVFAAASHVRKSGYPRVLSMILQAICYANRSQSDGYLPRLIVDSFHDPAPLVVADALVKAGLWESNPDRLVGGYHIHDYHDYQFSRQELTERQEVTRRQRQQAGLASARARQQKANGPVERTLNESVEPPCNEKPTTSHPIPSHPIEHVKEKQELARKIHSSADADYERFRNAYPISRRVGGKAARRAFTAATVGRNGTHLEAMHAALEQQKRSEQWQTPKLIPLMTTWLNGERWCQVLPETTRVSSAGQSTHAAAQRVKENLRRNAQ